MKLFDAQTSTIAGFLSLEKKKIIYELCQKPYFHRLVMEKKVKKKKRVWIWEAHGPRSRSNFQGNFFNANIGEIIWLAVWLTVLSEWRPVRDRAVLSATDRSPAGINSRTPGEHRFISFFLTSGIKKRIYRYSCWSTSAMVDMELLKSTVIH